MELKAQPQLFDVKTGEPMNADPAEIPKLVASGLAAFKRGEVIPAIDNDGKSVGIPSEDAAEAFKRGFSYEPLHLQEARSLKEQYGEGTGNEIRAGVEGTARGLSLGLSDVALKGLGADMEAVKARKEYNPIASTGSEIAGAIAPIILTGGGGAAVEGGGALTAGGLKAAAKYAPSALVAEAGTAVAKGVQTAVGAEAGSLAGRIAKGALPMATGSAVEGAVYGAGNTVSEAALGDPDLTAEKALANIGMTAALGGALGGLVGGVSGALSKKANFPQFISELDEGSKVGAPESFQAAMDSNVIRAEDKPGILKGLTEKKVNASEIEAAAAELGAPVLESQTSKSKAVQSADAMLLHPANVSPVAIARKEILNQGFEKAEGAVEESLGSHLGMSKAEVGNAIKKSLTDKLEAEAKPISALYDEIKKSTEFIPLEKRAISQITKNILELDEVTLSKSSPMAAIAKRVAEDLPALKTVDDIKRYKSMLNSSLSPTAAPAEKFVVRQIAEKLTNLEENTIVRYAEKFAGETADPEAKNLVNSLIEQRQLANKQYKGFIEKAGELGEVLGKKRVRGPGDFIDFLEDLTPEKITNKLFTKGNSEFLSYFAKNFPEEMKLLAQYQKNAIRDASLKDGVINVNRVLREVDKLEPEVQKALFQPHEIKKLNAARTWVNSLPPNVNPSGTAMVQSAKEFFESPKGAILGTIRDYGLEKFVKGAAGRGTDSATIKTLMKLEDYSQRATRDIKSSVKSFLTKAAPAATYLGTKSYKPEVQETPEDRRKFFEKQSAAVTSAATDPELLMNKTAAAYEGLTRMAPKVSQSLAAKSAGAAMFLYDKMPKNPNGSENIFSAKKWYPSDFEISKWKRYVDTVENPLGAMKDLKAGKLSTEQADTIKAVFPEVYKEITQTLMEEMPKLKEELPYQKRLQLGVLFDIPSDPSLQPKFIQQMQLMHMQASQTPNQGQGGSIPSGARTQSLNFAQKAMSGTERVIFRA
jgi:hypothetical protein